jgi:ubiquinone/menaquinone biosynthesis C-methylase UbiE
MSTRALKNAFPEAKELIGVDTSPEMVSMARAISLRDSFVQPIIDFITSLLDVIDQTLHRQSLDMKKARNKATAAYISQPTFSRGNAEHTHLLANSFDLVTIM